MMKKGEKKHLSRNKCKSKTMLSAKRLLETNALPLLNTKTIHSTDLSITTYDWITFQNPPRLENATVKFHSFQRGPK